MPYYNSYELIIRSEDQIAGGNNSRYNVQLGSVVPIYEQEFQCRLVKVIFDATGIVDSPKDPAGNAVDVVDIAVSFKNARGFDTSIPAIQSVIFCPAGGENWRPSQWFRITNINNQMINVSVSTLKKEIVSNAMPHVMVFEIIPLDKKLDM